MTAYLPRNTAKQAYFQIQVEITVQNTIKAVADVAYAEAGRMLRVCAIAAADTCGPICS
jgi:hypothetical protein